MKKFFSLLLAACLIAPSLLGGPGGRSSSSSSSSSRSYSSPSRSYSPPSRSYSSPSPASKPSSGGWGGFSKPSQPTPQATPRPSSPTVQSQPSKSGWGFFGGNKTATPATKPTPAPAMAKQAFTEQQKAQSRAAFQQYKQPVKPIQKQEYASSPVYNRVVASSGPRVTYRVYSENRVNFYRGYTPPIYVSYGRPSYGMYDAMFMWMMLDRINDDSYRRMYYNHYGDSAFREWRNEADHLAQDNAELRAKLSRMDNEVKQLQGQPQDPNYVPAGVDPSVMVSDDVAKQSFAQDQPAQAQVENDGFPKDKGMSGWTWFFIFAGVGLAGYGIYRYATRKPSNPYGRYSI